MRYLAALVLIASMLVPAQAQQTQLPYDTVLVYNAPCRPGELAGAGGHCLTLTARPVQTLPPVADASPSLPAGTYYVSPAGNDGGPGTQAAPWFTLANTAHLAANSTVLVSGTIQGCAIFGQSGMTLGTYGAGPTSITANCAVAPTSSSGGKAAAIHVTAAGFTYNGGTMRVLGNYGGSQYGILLDGNGNGATINNPDISGFFSLAATDWGAEIAYHGVANLTITGQGNDGIGGESSGHPVCYLHGTDSNALDDNGVSGWGPSTNITVTHCEIAYMESHAGAAPGSAGNGILFDGVAATSSVPCSIQWHGMTVCGLSEFNSTHDSGANVSTCGGPAGNWAYASDRVVIAHSESYRITASVPGGCDGDGFDLDGYTTNGLLAWNYSHDNMQEAFLFYQAGTWGPNWVVGSLSINDRLNGGAPFQWTGSNSSGLGYVLNNTFVTSSTGAMIPSWGGTGAPTGAQIANNLFWSFDGHFVDDEGSSTHPTYAHNDYFSTWSPWWRYGSPGYTTFAGWNTASGETGDLFADPLFTGTPSLTAPTCNNTTSGPQACATALGAYGLQSGSPVKGAGIAPSALPPGFTYDRDFFDAATGGALSIGAAN